MNKGTKRKAIIVVLAVLLVLTYLLPTKKTVKYDFLIGSEWDRGTLAAPFDFPVYKSDTEYSGEVKEYKESFIPVYKLDPEVKTTLLESITISLDVPQEGTDDDPFFVTERHRIARATSSTLEHLYRRGIVELYGDKERETIRVVSGDEIVTRDVSSLYTVKDSKALLARALSLEGYGAEKIEKYLLERFIRPNITFNQPLNDQMLADGVKKISKTKGFVTSGTEIVSDGERVTPQIAAMIESLNLEYAELGARNNSILQYVGNFIYLAFILIISCFSITLLFKPGELKFNAILFIATLYVFMAALCAAVYNIPGQIVSLYAVPLAIVPFYLSQFFNSRIAMVQYTFILLICAQFSTQPFDFITINLIAGIVGLYFLRRSYRRNSMFAAVAATFLTYVVVYFAFSFTRRQEFLTSDLYMVMWFAINAVLLLLFLQFSFVFEKLFRFVTNTTLLELSDTNQPLLKQLSEKAPGTFQHALQVANISEEAVAAIGGNTLLARTGALYHDIGKIADPAYFVENVRAAESPHNSVTPVESAKIINHHVEEGSALARRHRLPSIVADFISTHHGDSVIRYFYHKESEQHPGEDIDPQDFKYTGPPPFTKEQTVVMIADSAEAAARTLEHPDRAGITALVNSIIEGQQKAGQYRRSPLSFAELEKVKEVVINKLLDVYHARIAYPK